MALVKLNNRGVRSVSTFGSISSLGSYTFIKKLTASSSATLSFVDGSSDVVLDDTYKEYLFTFNNMHPATQNVDLVFNGSTDSGSNYNVTKTSTYFYATHSEADDVTGLAYEGDKDLAQSTAFQEIASLIGNDNDQSGSGYLHIFEPSSTTYVKHFIANANSARASSVRSRNQYVSGYFNTTSAIDAIQFKMDSGNIDAGDICLYGIN
jgi:hypothetical protein